MKTIILCGGFGTRLGLKTKKIPKPMVKIMGKPIVEHIINLYKEHGYKDFIIATGYKSEVLSKFFKEKNIKCVFTGLNTNTGGRLLKLKKFIKKGENFFLTYGDALSNQNINDLLKFHMKKKKIATVTAVRPPARFGEIRIKKKFLVASFKEKPNTSGGWINGGFFVLNFKFFSYLRKKNETLEREPMERLVKKNELAAYKHPGIWQCMDTPRDMVTISTLVKTHFNKQ